MVQFLYNQWDVNIFNKKYLKMALKKRIKEELGDDFNWVKDVSPFKRGSLFDSDTEVCFDSDTSCDINVNQNEIVFRLTEDDFLNLIDDENTEVPKILLGGGVFEGKVYDGRREGVSELDEDEFNYIDNLIDNKIKEKIIYLWFEMNDEMTMDDFTNIFDNSELLKLRRYIPNKDVFDNFISLIDEVVGVIEVGLHEQKWIETSKTVHREIKELLDKGIEIESDFYGDFTITIPMNVVNELRSKKNIDDFTNLLVAAMEPLVEIGWYDELNSHWDYGEETEEKVNSLLRSFLNATEEYITTEEYKVGTNILKYIKDSFNSSGWISETDSATSMYFKKYFPGNTNYAQLTLNGIRRFIKEKGNSKMNGKIYFVKNGTWFDDISVSSREGVSSLKEKINKFVEQVNKKAEKVFTQDKKINS